VDLPDFDPSHPMDVDSACGFVEIPEILNSSFMAQDDAIGFSHSH